MLRLLGSAKRLCDDLTRRDWLQPGGPGPFGLGLGDALGLQRAGAATPPVVTSEAACAARRADAGEAGVRPGHVPLPK
jgi:hypothetical protein